MDRETKRLVERGEGYWVFEKEATTDHPPMVATESGAVSEPISIESETVYRPVKVDTNSDGEVYAYFYDTDMPFEEMLETGGKRFVPTQQVHLSPPKSAKPAYKVD